jgi:hypothetical protein
VLALSILPAACGTSPGSGADGRGDHLAAVGGDSDGGGTITLDGGSPALGRGAACPPTDARGNPRSAARCTAGAVEGST